MIVSSSRVSSSRSQKNLVEALYSEDPEVFIKLTVKVNPLAVHDHSNSCSHSEVTTVAFRKRKKRAVALKGCGIFIVLFPFSRGVKCNLLIPRLLTCECARSKHGLPSETQARDNAVVTLGPNCRPSTSCSRNSLNY